MGYPAKKEEKKYTYGDYLTWPDDERWELIDGVAYDMTPAPSRVHQKLLGNLFSQIYNYLKNKKCEVYLAPFDVRLPDNKEKDEDITTVVQPDIVVVCDKNKLDDRGCRGAPDIAIEIISPYTVQKDMQKKFTLYERVKVKEYWIVHPVDKTVMVFQLNKKGGYNRPLMYLEKDTIPVKLLGALKIDLKQVFVS